MARRSAPPNSGPSYLPPSSHPLTPHHSTDPSESQFQRFMREQVFAPEKFAGNVSILTGMGMFFGGILAVRLWGEALVGDI